ncbi:basic proline-rich protein-like [Eumetopias jubatus]|uniref:basic proline-rich protein-like n=1 Tax=Eumetopias jubatus TaxID=34886 RepID=UPI0010165D30|nr:basic proline-rich protein-like [Eumetopias jubatus]
MILGGRERGVRVPPPPRKIWGPTEGRGTHRVRSAGEQQQQERPRPQQQAGTHGARRAPLRGGAVGRAPRRPPALCAHLARELSALRGGPGRPPRPEEPWLWATQPAASPRTARPRKRWRRAKQPSPLIRTRGSAGAPPPSRYWRAGEEAEGARGGQQAAPAGSARGRRRPAEGTRCLSLGRCNTPESGKSAKFWGPPAGRPPMGNAPQTAPNPQKSPVAPGPRAAAARLLPPPHVPGEFGRVPPQATPPSPPWRRERVRVVMATLRAGAGGCARRIPPRNHLLCRELEGAKKREPESELEAGVEGMEGNEAGGVV